MAVMPRETWTDERLDDLKEGMNGRFDQVDKRFDQVDKRFDQVDKRFDRVDIEIKEIRGEIKATRTELKGEIDGLRGDIQAMQYTMNQGFTTVYRTMFIGFATIVAALIGTAAL